MLSDVRYRPTLDLAEIRAHTEQSHALWGGKATVAERLQALTHRMGELGPGGLFLSGLVDSQGRLLASLKRYALRLRIQGQPVPCVGLGAIFTPEPFRRAGLANRLIQTVLEESRHQHGCGAALLYSDIAPAFYEKHGFALTPATGWKIPTLALPAGAALSVRPSRADEGPRLLQWYQQYTEAFTFRTERSLSTWPVFRSINRVDHDLILSDGEVDVGFISLSYQREAKFTWIDEWCVDARGRARVWPTIRALALAQDLPEVRGWELPGMEPLVALEKNARTKAVPMVALLDPRLKPDTSDRGASAYFASADHF